MVRAQPHGRNRCGRGQCDQRRVAEQKDFADRSQPVFEREHFVFFAHDGRGTVVQEIRGHYRHGGTKRAEEDPEHEGESVEQSFIAAVQARFLNVEAAGL